jgi:UDP-3-O-[3-hydroxymyristoyl] glucosamine N-acyltransferase
MPTVPLGEIVDFINGQYPGNRNLQITAVAPLAEAREDQLSFLSNRKYSRQLEVTKAGAILVPNNMEGTDERWIRVENPYFAAAQIMTRWFHVRLVPKGVSPQASIAPSVKLGSNVSVGPFATIGEDVVIGSNVTIFQGSSIEAGSTIGEDTIIYPNAIIYHGTKIGRRCVIHAGVIIGADGYGFTTHEGKHHKIPQIGIVRIEDDVEIGAATTIDRAVFGETVIGEGTKIDNLVQVGHNVRMGKHCLIVAQVGIAGSTELGDSVVVGGQAGIKGHLRIGNRVQIAGGSHVYSSLPDDAKVIGAPARPFKEYVRLQGALKRLGKGKKA